MGRTLFASMLLAVLPVVALGQQSARTIYQLGDGVTAPSAVKIVEPTYTPQARAAAVQGFVFVEAVVSENGTVDDAKVIQSRLYSAKASTDRRDSPTFLADAEVTKLGLDERAIAAAEQWTFEPGTRDGKPVPMRITIEMRFSLQPPKQER